MLCLQQPSRCISAKSRSSLKAGVCITPSCIMLAFFYTSCRSDPQPASLDHMRMQRHFHLSFVHLSDQQQLKSRLVLPP